MWRFYPENKRIFTKGETICKDSFVKESLQKARQFEWAVEYTDALIEQYTIEKTNHLMLRHYGEPFRDSAYHKLGLETSIWEKQLLTGDDVAKQGRTGTEHDPSFISVPVCDLPDPVNDRSAQIITLFHNCLMDESAS